MVGADQSTAKHIGDGFMQTFLRPRKNFLRMPISLATIPQRPLPARSAGCFRQLQPEGLCTSHHLGIRKRQITGSAQAASSLRPVPAANLKACSWLALRASVLRRAVSQWARPRRTVIASRSSAGRELQCPLSYRAATRLAKLPSRRQYWSRFGLGLPLTAALQAWPNRPLNRNANGGLLLRASAASSAPFGVRLASR